MSLQRSRKLRPTQPRVANFQSAGAQVSNRFQAIPIAWKPALRGAARWGLAGCALGALLALVGPHSVRGGESNGGLKPESLTVAYTKAAFLNVNRADVEAGYKVLAQTVGRRRGYLVTAKVQVFDQATEFEAILREEPVRLIVVDAWRYLGMDTSKVTPFFVSSERGQVGKQYLLLTRQGSGLNTLADLRGKEIAVYEVANTTQGRAWLGTLLLENRGGTFREDLIQTLAAFHREPAGAQILTLFKTDRLIPFEEAHLMTIRKLRATYDRLRKETKPPASMVQDSRP